MAIFIDGLSARNGGGVTYLQNLIDTMPDMNNLEIYIISQNAVYPKIKNKRVKHISTNWPTQNPVLRAIWQFFVLPLVLRKLKANILFVPGGINFCNVPKYCKMITMFRNMLPFDKMQLDRYPLGLNKIKFFIQKYLILNTLNNADFIIFISKYSKSFMVKKFPHLQKKNTVIPHGVDKKFYVNKKIKRKSMYSKDKYILYGSRIEYYKRQMEVLEAFYKVNKVYNDFKLYFIGPENNDYAESLKKEIENKNLSSKVLIMGEIKQNFLPNYFQNSFLNIFISETENCPNILLEALCAGRPIICSDRDPMPEFGGKAPIYCSPDNTSEIANSILKIIKNKNIYNKMSQASLKQSNNFKKSVSGKKTWKTILKHMS